MFQPVVRSFFVLINCHKYTKFVSHVLRLCDTMLELPVMLYSKHTIVTYWITHAYIIIQGIEEVVNWQQAYC